MAALLLLILWPIAELFVAIEVGRAIGVLATIVLLLAGWPLGMWAMRSQGATIWRRLTLAVSEGRTPGRDLLDGGLVLIGGWMLMVPGFITDAIGVLLLLPPARALIRPVLMRNLQSRFVVRAARYSRRPYDVDSTARDVDQPHLRP